MIIIRLLKLLLIPFAILYWLIMWIRNKLYDTGKFRSVKFDIPVICVGNLSTGGTGKTPHIEYLIRLLQNDFNIATQSRGYKRRSKGFKLANDQSTAFDIGDEPMQFHLKFPTVTVSVAEDRMTGIPNLIDLKPALDVILLDDAFQHRTVRAGLNILITDYSKPFFNDYILPYGNLREQRKGYKRANIIIVSKCPDRLSVKAQEDIVLKINPLASQKVFFTKINYGACFDFFSRETVELKAKYNVLLIAGIANPAPLEAYVAEKVNHVKLLKFPDHHYFGKASLEEIKKTYDQMEKKELIIVTTEKDATRLDLNRSILASWGIQILVLAIEISFLNNQNAFDQGVLRYVNEKEYK